MFMKKIILLLSLILMGFGAFSQALPIDSRLYAKYSEEDLLNMQQNLPSKLEYLNWVVEIRMLSRKLQIQKGWIIRD